MAAPDDFFHRESRASRGCFTLMFIAFMILTSAFGLGYYMGSL